MKDLHKKSVADLQKMLTKAKTALREFRFKSAGSHTRNVKEGRALRLEIARILTELNARK